MAAIEIVLDRDDNLEWYDDVDAYRCAGCNKVMIQRYVAPCQHEFCIKCTQEEGSDGQQWRCPKCRKTIRNLDQQTPQLNDAVMDCLVHCSNRQYGCEHMFPFKDIKEHLAGCEHTKERALSVHDHESPTFELQNFRRISECYKEEADFIWIVSIKRLLRSRNPIRRLFCVKELLSERFPLTGYPFGAQAMITLYDTKVWVCLFYRHLSTSIANEESRVKPLPRLYFTLKDQSNRNFEPKDLIKTTQFSLKTEFKFNELNVITFVDKSLLTSPLYTVNGKWAIEIHVEAPEVARSVHSRDGILTWIIDDFRRKKQMEVDGLIEYHLSPYFYTAPNGLRVQARAYLNGCDAYEKKGVSVGIAFMNGVNDGDLNGPYDVHKTKVTISHPTHPNRFLSKSQQGIPKYDTLLEMGSHAEIKTLLHNDTLYLKIKTTLIT